MRACLSTTTRLALIAGAALAVAACGGSGGESVVSENVADDAESNLFLDAPGNDASALESVTPVEPLPPVANVGEELEPVAGETTAVDSGGNTVDSDVAGM